MDTGYVHHVKTHRLDIIKEPYWIQAPCTTDVGAV